MNCLPFPKYVSYSRTAYFSRLQNPGNLQAWNLTRQILFFWQRHWFFIGKDLPQDSNILVQIAWPRSWRSGWVVRLTSVSIYDKRLVGPSICPVYTRCCFTMTNMIQARSHFNWARAIIINNRLDDIDDLKWLEPDGGTCGEDWTPNPWTLTPKPQTLHPKPYGRLRAQPPPPVWLIMM